MESTNPGLQMSVVYFFKIRMGSHFQQESQHTALNAVSRIFSSQDVLYPKEVE